MADQEQLPGDEDEQAPLPVVAEGDDAADEEEPIVDSKGNPTVLNEEGIPIEREVIVYPPLKECAPCKSGAPAWMATFADMATLLMAFFCIAAVVCRDECA